MKKISKPIFTGVATALVTPFKNGKIDFKSLEQLIEFQISEGVDALLVCGTTGESATLDDREKKELISFAVGCVRGRVPLIAGTGSNDTRHALELSKFASDEGADALLLVTPYYNKASDGGLILHYETIANGCDAPIILYNVPSRTGVNIPIGVLEHLAEHPNIVGLKEASGSVSYLARATHRCGERMHLYSGNDDLIVPTLSLGGLGVISVLSNVLPKKTAEICRLFFEGKVEKARELQLRLLPLINALFCEVNPIPVKALLSLLGFCEEEYRLPLCPLERAKAEELAKILHECDG